MKNKVLTKILLVILCCSMLLVCVEFEPATASNWITVNDDPNLNGPEGYANNSWESSTWGRAEEGNTIFPTMSMSNGIATTQLVSYDDGNWEDGGDAAGYKQDIEQGAIWSQGGVSATMPQKVSYNVKPNYQSTTGNPSYFNLFFEIWVDFSSPTGSASLQRAELMVRQRVIVNNADPGTVGTYVQETTIIGDGNGDRYLIEYRDTDTTYNQWVSHEHNIKSLLLDRLASTYSVDLSKGTVFSLIFGVEGYSTSGGMGAQWDYVNYQANYPLLQDTFSAGNFNKWTYNSGASIQSAGPTYIAQGTGTNAYDASRLDNYLAASQSTVYACVDMNFANLNIASGQRVQLLSIQGTDWTNSIVASIQNVGGANYWTLETFIDGTQTSYFGSYVSPAMNTWNRVILARDLQNNVAILAVNGITLISLSYSSSYPTTIVMTGLVWQSGSGYNQIYFDNVWLSSSSATILLDNFDNGNFNQWTYNEGASLVAVSTDYASYAPYYAKGAGSNAGAESRLDYYLPSSESVITATVDMNFASLNIPTGQRVQLLSIQGTDWTNSIVASVQNDGGIYKWTLETFVGGSQTSYLVSSGPTFNTWYHIQLIRNLQNNQAQLYINGALVRSLSYSSSYPTTIVLTGLVWQSSSGYNQLNFDNVVVTPY